MIHCNNWMSYNSLQQSATMYSIMMYWMSHDSLNEPRFTATMRDDWMSHDSLQQSIYCGTIEWATIHCNNWMSHDSLQQSTEGRCTSSATMDWVRMYWMSQDILNECTNGAAIHWMRNNKRNDDCWILSIHWYWVIVIRGALNAMRHDIEYSVFTDTE